MARRIRPPSELQGVTVFDSDCASVYVERENDVAYVPFGLDLLTKLAAACDRVGSAIRTELGKLARASVTFPDELLGETAVGRMLRTLGSPDSESCIDELSSLTETEEQRLTDLRARLAQFKAHDPEKRSQELHLRAQRLDSLGERIVAITARLSAPAVEKLRQASAKARQAQEAAQLASQITFEREPIKSVGGDTWRALWEAARRYSESEVYPGRRFPVIDVESVCVLCQQALSTQTADRLTRFERFVQDAAQVAADRATSALTRLRAELRGVLVRESGDNHLLAELAVENAGLAEHVRAYLSQMADRKARLDKACDTGRWDSVPEPLAPPQRDLRALADEYRTRALELRKAKIPEERQNLERELAELEARALLYKIKGQAKAEARRLRVKAQLEECLAFTDTTGITRLNTRLTREVVTDHLRERFQGELNSLQLQYLTVTVEPKGGRRGVMYHRVELAGALHNGWEIEDVLSQGEHRCVALAAFLAELDAEPRGCAAVLDDPVSSLDHHRREIIAMRLVHEAKRRSLIVFTHDLIFLMFLEEHAEREGVGFEARHLSYDRLRRGVPIGDLPWHGLKTTKRVGYLRDRVLNAKKLYKSGTKEEYERETAYIYGLLREAWERAVEEVLLNAVVLRFGREVQTKRLEKLLDLQASDIRTVDAAMTKCSALLPGHDQPPGVNVSMPGPDELSKDVEQLESWRQAIVKRRS